MITFHELAKPGLLRLLDEPIGLDVIERPDGRELRARYPENGVLLHVLEPEKLHRREIYLSRTGRFLLFDSWHEVVLDDSIQIVRELDHELSESERQDYLGDQQAIRALLHVMDRKIGRARDKIMILGFQRRRLERSLHQKPGPNKIRVPIERKEAHGLS